MVTQEYTGQLDAEWTQIRLTFSEFHNNRDLMGVYKLVKQAKLPPDLHPDLLIFAQGLRYMSGMLREDFRQLKQLHGANPTYKDTVVAGSSQAAHNLARDFKLVWSSWWDNKLNKGDVVYDRIHEGVTELGISVERMHWCPKPDEEYKSGCPVKLEQILVDCVGWQGNFLDPDAFWYRYSLPVIDCNIKNSKGMRPSYGEYEEGLGWVGEPLPTGFYKNNAQKKVDIIVRDAVDPVAMCCLPGCMHRKRRITTMVCKEGGKEADYETVSVDDSPFEHCSFVITGGDVNWTERDPNEILRPSAWILIDLVIKYNVLFNTLLATHAMELSTKRMYVNAGATNPEVLQALTPEDDGQTLEAPAIGSNIISQMPGPISQFPKPSTTELMELLRETIRQYERYRPNDNLTGNAAVSEVTGTAAQLNRQGAGLMLEKVLENTDSAHERFFYETMHAICFAGYFESEDEQTRYVATVSGREMVMGSKGSAGEELFLDAKKAAHPVTFTADTSADTPQDRRDREERARTAKAAGIFTKDDVFKAYGITDPVAQEEALFNDEVDAIAKPIELRRIAQYMVASSASQTGVDLGEEGMIKDMPMPDPQQPQTYNTLAANRARTQPAPPALEPTAQPNQAMP